MALQRTCPHCGKRVTVPADAAAAPVACGACGGILPPPSKAVARGLSQPGSPRKPEVQPLLPVPAPPMPASTNSSEEVSKPSQLAAEGTRHVAGRKTGAAAAILPEVVHAIAPNLAAREATVPPQQAGNGPTRAKRRLPLAWAAAAGFVLLLIGLAAGWALFRPHTSRSGDFAADQAANADLVALKSDAEALAIEGKFPEAHEKYRQISRLAAGRNIKDPLLWDIVERAKSDQDRIYAILLARAGAADAASTTAPVTQATVSETRPDPSTAPAYAGPFAARPSLADVTPPRYLPDLTPAPTPRPEPQPPATLPADGGGATPQRPAPPTTTPSAVAAGESPATSPAASRPADAPPAAGAAMAATLRPDVGVRPTVRGGPLVGDADITRAIRSGCDFLLGQFKDDELSADIDADPMRRYGLHALSVYALLQAGYGSNDPRLNARSPQMKGLIDKLKSFDLSTDRTGAFRPVVYGRSLRAAALAVYNRPEDQKALKADVDWLVAAQTQGAYTYDDRYARPAPNGGGPGADAGPIAPFSPEAYTRMLAQMQGEPGGDRIDAPVVSVDLQRDPRTGQMYEEPKGGANLPPPLIESDNQKERWRRFEFPWDNSNSQYGLLGVWAGAEVGVEVPAAYWRAVQQHWVSCQFPDGAFPYRAGDKDKSLAMACAGVSSLMVTHDYLEAGAAASAVGRVPYSRPIISGLTWLDKGNTCVDVTSPLTHYIGYDMYGVSRAGLASGFKYFGGHDWFLELAEKAVASQRPNGSWGASDDGQNAVIDSSYVVLFLARGRHPVMMNKLRFDGFWVNRPRDLANLTRYAGRLLERPLNWQVVGLDVVASDWLDSPILYIASHRPPNFTDADYDKLRAFVEQGGLIFTHADGGADAFNKWVPELVKRVCPTYEMQALPEGHDLYTINYRLKASIARLQAVGNGARFLIVHSPVDLSTQWQGRNEKLHPEAYQLAVNLFLYASGKTDLRNRLSSPAIPEPTSRPTDRIRIARRAMPATGTRSPARGDASASTFSGKRAWRPCRRWSRWPT